MLSFQPQVTLGELIEAVVIFVSVVGAYFALKSEVKRNEVVANIRHEQNTEKFNALIIEVAKQNPILERIAVLDSRQTEHERRISNLERK